MGRHVKRARQLVIALTMLITLGVAQEVSAAGAPAGRFSVTGNENLPDQVRQAVFAATTEWQDVLNDDDLFDAAEDTRTNINVVWDTKHDGQKSQDNAVAVTKSVGTLARPAFEIILYKRDINRAFKQDGFVSQDQQLKTIMVHELGHALGVKHSQNLHDVMYPMALGPTQHITARDVQQLPFAVREGVQQALAKQDDAWFAPRRWAVMLTQVVVTTLKRPHSLQIAALSLAGAVIVTIIGTVVYNRRNQLSE